MKSMRMKLCALLLSASAVSVTGCFGESVLSAASKVLSGQISQLTANEIIILNQTAIDIIASQNIGYTGSTLTVPQAEAVSSFLKVNDLNTIDDFETFSQMAQDNPDAVEGWDELSAAFAGSDYDNAEGEFDAGSFDNLFGAILGGVNNPGDGSNPTNNLN